MEKSKQNTDFLQSVQWRKFQESAGKKTYLIESENFSASIVEHELPIVGKYFYVPHGPIASLEGEEFQISNFKFQIFELIRLAKENNAGWVRIEPENEELLKTIKENTKEKIVKAPHDMQPKEVFVLDISKSAEQLLTEMKPKTRYNIGVAKKKNVKIVSSGRCHSGLDPESTRILNQVQDDSGQYVEAFLKLTKEMADRQGITAHAEQYYRKMIESLPEEMLKIYVAEFEGKIIAANLVLFFEGTATYLHGASSNLHRNAMAPFLLQWQQILDAKERGCTRYDFGGVKTNNAGSWEGITSFKFGFSPHTKPLEFPGSYDIIVNPRAYSLYRGLQMAKAFAYRFRK